MRAKILEILEKREDGTEIVREREVEIIFPEGITQGPEFTRVLNLEERIVAIEALAKPRMPDTDAGLEERVAVLEAAIKPKLPDLAFSCHEGESTLQSTNS